MGAAATTAIRSYKAARRRQDSLVNELNVDQAVVELEEHPVEQAEDAITLAFNEAEDRRIRRQPKGRHGQQPRCGSCRLFITNPAIACPHCGFNGLGGFPS